VNGDLRCGAKKHGAMVDDHTFEVKCSSRFCGAIAGQVVVFHRWDIRTGNLTKTLRFKQPGSEVKQHDDANRPAVRTA
jgi:hypothetical protein